MNIGVGTQLEAAKIRIKALSPLKQRILYQLGELGCANNKTLAKRCRVSENTLASTIRSMPAIGRSKQGRETINRIVDEEILDAIALSQRGRVVGHPYQNHLMFILRSKWSFFDPIFHTSFETLAILNARDFSFFAHLCHTMYKWLKAFQSRTNISQRLSPIMR